jgi:hypothetical protein
MPMSKYQEFERNRAINKIKSKSSIFYGATGGEYFRNIKRDFVIKEKEKNFYEKIYFDVVAYFEKNDIGWWGGKKPTGHVLSSQIACLNHLFYIKNDKKTVLDILSSFSKDFIDVLKIKTDIHNPGFIQFEAVSDKDHLNEGTPKRGQNCTSIDALIYAKHKDGSLWLILIEWKYTEHYNNSNKATDGCFNNPLNCEGRKRRIRYTKLICNSKQLKNSDHFCYYFEPFYQLMRQTLWAEQMIKNKSTETLKADNYLHIHVIPSENEDLLNKNYKCSGLNMETTWRNHLVDKNKYIIISPKELFKNLDIKKYHDLYFYLNERYWK